MRIHLTKWCHLELELEIEINIFKCDNHFTKKVCLLCIFTVVEQEAGLRHGMSCRWQSRNRERVGSAAESAPE